MAQKTLHCANMGGTFTGTSECNRAVTMVDDRGFIYCAHCGLTRRSSGVRCRKLTPAELRTLSRGEAIARY